MSFHQEKRHSHGVVVQCAAATVDQESMMEDD